MMEGVIVISVYIECKQFCGKFIHPRKGNNIFTQKQYVQWLTNMESTMLVTQGMNVSLEKAFLI